MRRRPRYATLKRPTSSSSSRATPARSWAATAISWPATTVSCVVLETSSVAAEVCCAPCVAFVNTYRGTISAARKLHDVDIPPELKKRLLAVLRAQRAAKP